MAAAAEKEALQEVAKLAEAPKPPSEPQAVINQSDAVLSPSAAEPEPKPVEVEDEPLARPESLQLPEERGLATPMPEPKPTAPKDAVELAEEIINAEPPQVRFFEEAQQSTATLIGSPGVETTPTAGPQPESELKSSLSSSHPPKPSAVEDEPAEVSTVTHFGTAPAAPSSSRSVGAAATQPEINEEPETAPASAPELVEPNARAGDSPAIAPPSADTISSLKSLPKVAAEAAVHAGQAYVEAGKEARLTLKDLLSLREKEGPPVTLTVDQIAVAAFFLVLAVQFLFLPIFLPSTFRLLYSLLWGLALGLGLSFLFFLNAKKKKEANELLATELGLKGVQLVAGLVPAVFSVSETEKMEWLNALVEEVWPYVDKAVCNMIKEAASQQMPGILASLPGMLSGTVKSVSFKHLTFGAAPVRVESIKVAKEHDDGLAVELSVKWCGDPNITLAIEILGGQKLCPRVLDISFAATARVLLKPLVPRLPGFVAVMATLPKPPLIKYRLDFGKALGGSMAPAAVTPVINFFLRGMMDRMLVWPNRVVVPILQETPQDTGVVSLLTRRIRGVLRVCVLRGKALKDLDPTDEACVELTTDSEYFEATPGRAAVSPEDLAAADGKIERVANTELVTWEHFIYLLVQEPETQMLRLEAFDLSAGRRTKGGAGQGAQITGRRSVGRALVKLGRVCKAGMEGSQEQMPVRVQLGEGDWGSPGGPGKGAGTLQLKMTYFPSDVFTKEQVQESQKGIISVRLLAVSGLSPGVNNNVTVYSSYQLSSHKRDGKPSCQTGKQIWTLANYANQLKAQMRKLELERDQAIRQGNTAAAEAKAAEMRILQADIDVASDPKNQANRSRNVTLGFIMDSSALSAFYQVEEKLPETGEDNLITIKVVQEGRVKRVAETLGTLHIPVSVVKNSCAYNSISRKFEHGLHSCKWKLYDPDRPGVNPPESEWGWKLEGSASVRIWAMIRYTPCVQAKPEETIEEGEEAGAAQAMPSGTSPAKAEGA